MADTPPKWKVEIRSDELTDETIVTAQTLDIGHNTGVSSLVVVCKRNELTTALFTGQLWPTTGQDVQLRFDKGEILYMRWATAPGMKMLFSQDRRLFKGLTTTQKLVARVSSDYESPVTLEFDIRGFRSVAGVLLDHCPRAGLVSE